MADASNDIFVQDLEAEFGDTGYAFWFKTLELLGSQGNGGVLDISENVWRQVIHSHRIDHLRRLYAFCMKREKFKVENLPNGLLRITCSNFAKYADNYTKYGKELQSNFEESLKNVDANRIEKNRIEVEEKNTVVETAISTWNNFASHHNLSAVSKITDKRRSGVLARFEEKDFDFPKILTEIANSEFLLGLKTHWKVHFDFIFTSKNNWVKIIEGNYRNNGKHTTGIKPGGTKSDQVRRAEFKHGPEDVERFNNSLASLKEIERNHKKP